MIWEIRMLLEEPRMIVVIYRLSVRHFPPRTEECT